MTLFMYPYCLTCETVEDFLLFIRSSPFLSLWFLADSVSIRDSFVLFVFLFLINSHSYRLRLRSLLRYKSILSFSLA